MTDEEAKELAKIGLAPPGGESKSSNINDELTKIGLKPVVPKEPSAPPASGPTTSFSDYGKLALQGLADAALTAPGQAIKMATGSERMLKRGQRVASAYRESLSPGAKQVAQNKLIEDGRLGDTPVQTVLQTVATSIPQLLVSAGVGGPLVQGLSRLGVAGKFGGGAVGRLAEAAPLSVVEGAQAAFLNAAQQGSEIRDALSKATDEQLSKNKAYQAALAETGDRAAAIESLANAGEKDVALRTGLSTGGIGLLTGGAALGPLTRRLLGTPTAKEASEGVIKRVAKGFGSEAGQETLQSGGEQFIGNLATRDYVDENQPLGSGVLNAMATGLAAGGITGAGVGLIGGGGQQPVLSEAAGQLPEAGSPEPGIPSDETSVEATEAPKESAPLDPNAGTASRGVIAGQVSGAIPSNDLGGPVDKPVEPEEGSDRATAKKDDTRKPVEKKKPNQKKEKGQRREKLAYEQGVSDLEQAIIEQELAAEQAFAQQSGVIPDEPDLYRPDAGGLESEPGPAEPRSGLPDTDTEGTGQDSDGLLGGRRRVEPVTDRAVADEADTVDLGQPEPDAALDDRPYSDFYAGLPDGMTERESHVYENIAKGKDEKGKIAAVEEFRADRKNTKTRTEASFNSPTKPIRDVLREEAAKEGDLADEADYWLYGYSKVAKEKGFDAADKLMMETLQIERPRKEIKERFIENFRYNAYRHGYPKQSVDDFRNGNVTPEEAAIRKFADKVYAAFEPARKQIVKQNAAAKRKATIAAKKALANAKESQSKAAATKRKVKSTVNKAKATAERSITTKPIDAARDLQVMLGKEGGIAISELAEITGYKSGKGSKGYGNPSVGSGKLFRKNGRQLDDVITTMLEAKYITQADIDSAKDNGGANGVRELIGKAIRGEPITSSLNEDAVFTQRAEEAAQADQAQADQEFSSMMDEVVEEGSFLKSQTAEEAAAEAKAKAKAKAEERKKEAAPPPEDFKLAGSDTDVDSARASGAQDLPGMEENPPPFRVVKDNPAWFSIKKDQGADLYVGHNLSEENLRVATELGGLPVPSLGVSRTTTGGFRGYGDITLIAPKEILNEPKSRTFDADIYSPRQPRAVNEVDDKVFKSMKERLAVNSYLDDYNFMLDAIENEGFKAILRNESAQYLYLQSVGNAPKIKSAKIEPLIAKAAKKFGDTPTYLTREDPELAGMAKKYFLSRTGTNTSKFFEDNGDVRFEFLDLFAKKARAASRDQGVDVAELRAAIATRMRSKSAQSGMERFVKEDLAPGIIKKKVLQVGTRKKPYTLDNLVRHMVKDLQGGEGFDYGTGSIRAKYAKELRNVTQVQLNRDRIVSGARFAQIKSASHAKLDDLLEYLSPLYKFDSKGFGYAGDASAAIAEGSKGLREAFNMNDEAFSKVNEFVDYLRGLPTEYFESKIQRSVELSEFVGAVVPNGAKPETVEALKNAGLKIRRYSRGLESSRVEAIEKIGALFHRSDKTTVRSVESVQSIVDEITGKWTNAPDIIVLPTVSDAPRGLAGQAAQQNEQGAASQKVAGAFYDGKVYVFADAAKDQKDITKTVLHESFGHYGLQGVFGENMPAIRDLIAKERPQLMDAKVKEYGLDPSNDFHMSYAAEEVFAEMAQENPQLGLVKRVVAMIRTALRRMGINTPLSDAEIIRNVLEPARKFVQEGRPTQAFSEFNGQVYKETVQIENTGQTATLEHDAGNFLRDMDSRLKSAQELLVCLGG